jgi:hypothetical protein
MDDPNSRRANLKGIAMAVILVAIISAVLVFGHSTRDREAGTHDTTVVRP